MTTGKRPGGLPVVSIVLAVLCLFLAAFTVKLWLAVEATEKRITLLRVLSPGRTRTDVIQWMGPPDQILDDHVISGRRFPHVLHYKSVPTYDTRMNGTEDIWIGLDANDTVVVTYYPDFAQDRANLERGAR